MEKKIVLVLSLMVLVLVVLTLLFVSQNQSDSVTNVRGEESSESNLPVIVEDKSQKEIGEVYFPEKSGCGK